MNVGLFGGSFNPPHLGHLIIAETVREQFRLDQVWWIPAFSPPHKRDRTLAAPAQRLDMTRQAIANNPGFAVSAIEVQRQGASYTVDTVRELQETYPDHAFSLIIGGDSLHDFGTWYRPDEIVARVPLIVYPRPGWLDAIVAEPHSALRIQVVEAPLLEISSTDIRERVRTGRSIRYLVPEAVCVYIEEHRLYRA